MPTGMLSTALIALLAGATPELTEGRLQYSALSWSRAAELLATAAADARNSQAERAEAFDLLARAHLALGNAALARAAYEGLVDLDPMAPDPDGSPKVRAAFREAKERRYPPRFVQLVRRASGRDVLEVEVLNPWRHSLTYELQVEAPGASPELRLLDEQQGRLVAALAAGSRCVLTARFADGAPAGTVGSAAEPIVGPAALAPAAAATPTPAPSSQTATPAAAAKWSSRTLGVVVALGLSVALLLTGLGVGWSGLSDLDASDGTPSQPPAVEAGLQRSGQTKLYSGVGLVSVGVAGSLATGLLLFLWRDQP